ncbi:MAG TPA: hypothetical protein VL096_18275 [Pirellulaceae bacterium]|nr:hypothetical protein [Pirellulaceae bacterium]
MDNEPQVPGPGKRLYRVELGHNSVMVECASEAEAIRAAKTKLSLELPRLWDVIERLTPDKFQVSKVY